MIRGTASLRAGDGNVMTSETAQFVSYGSGEPYETLIVEVEDRVATVTLNRPERGNALNATLHAELGDFWEGAREDDDIWCVIITGAGRRHFCTGADMREAASGAEGRVGQRRVYGLPWPYRFYKPIITALNGTTAGGGLLFVWESHIVIAADHVDFLEPHLSVSQLPAGEIYGLADAGLPWPVALRMALMGTAGERVSAQRMYDLGLVTEIVPYEQLLERAREIADIVMQMSPLVTRLLLEGAWRMRDGSLGPSESSRWAHDEQQARGLRDSEDATEGPRAFVEKRRPVWTGR